ncbi:MAG: cell envelope integrity protein CreD [Marinomonas sp.]
MSEDGVIEGRPERSPGVKLLFVGLIAAVLIVPLMLVWALVYDRQNQAETAQSSIVDGWGGSQTIAGPMISVPFTTTEEQATEVDGKVTTRTVEVERTLFLSPTSNDVETAIDPKPKKRSIYQTVVYNADVKGKAKFALPADLERFGIDAASLQWGQAQLRVGISDARGLTEGGKLLANGEALLLRPGRGPAATNGQGFFAFLDWAGEDELTVDYEFGLRGNQSLNLVPRGGRTTWAVNSTWPSPSFYGSFGTDASEVSDKGFKASWLVDKLALGQPPVSTDDYGPPQIDASKNGFGPVESYPREAASSGESRVISVDLIEPVDLYSKVDRSVKYGFLFIGFTFLAYFLFDIVGGARVAAAEYLLTGAGLVLFFILLLAFAEVVGFTFAYIAASAATIGLLAAYSAAVLGSRKRAMFMGALLVGLYALLFVLLNLEGLSLLIGSVMLFLALAGVMYATRNIDWSSVGRAGKVEAQTSA